MLLLYSIIRLNDFDNACAAYNKAIELNNGDDYLTYLNYALTLYINDEIERCREYFARFTVAFEALTIDTSEIDEEIIQQANLLKTALTK